MMNHLKRIKTLVLVLALTSTSAYAAIGNTMEKEGYMGALAGASIANSSDSKIGNTTNSTFGLEAGVKIIPELGIGFYGTYFSQNNSNLIMGIPLGASTRTYHLLGEVNLYASVFHFGADLGAGIHSWSASLGGNAMSSSNTALIFGPEAGFDIPLGQTMMTLGAEAHYLLTSSSEGKNNLQILGALKFWL